ncbi:MAG: D-alanyl-D-alanine carboxypeptidase family protein [bacterium]|nr:D-alanyl-D-alanine carboxypeptidase family protein [bacterium]
MRHLFAFITIFLVLLCTENIQLNATALADSAEAAVVINAYTNEVLFAKNADSKLPMASTTKIMTSLILAEQPDLDKKIITTREMVTVEGSSMGLLPGDTVTYYGLLCGMLLSSGNDAANTTAISLAGSVENFAVLMNKKAKEIGMKNTNFVTASGLDAQNHYSTAYDMAILGAYAMKNRVFREVASSKSKTVEYGNIPYRRTLTNHNKLLKYYEHAIGVKTGFTKKSGRCLVSCAEQESKRIVAVTLDDPNDWDDHKQLLEHGFSQLDTYTLKCDISEIAVVGGKADVAKLYADDCKIGLTESDYSKIKKRYSIPKFVYAPVKSEKIGTVDYLIDGNVICSTDITTFDNVEIDEVEVNRFWIDFLSNFKRILMFNC